LGGYVVDFVCFDKKLIIEIDGGQHNDYQFVEKDKERTRWLHSEGFRVIRFWNNDVLKNTDGVMMQIRRALEPFISPSPWPSPIILQRKDQ
jgi:very-short-patch-repair endonuclease